MKEARQKLKSVVYSKLKILSSYSGSSSNVVLWSWSDH